MTHEVAVATGRSADDVIADFAIEQGVMFRGHADDVAARAVDACRFFGWDAFARICGDRPFYDIAIVDSAIDYMINEPCDLITTEGKVFSASGANSRGGIVGALERFLPNFSKFHREHLTSFFYERTDYFRINSIEHPEISIQNYSTKLVVDTPMDFDRAIWISKQVRSNQAQDNATTLQLLDLALSWDQLNLKKHNLKQISDMVILGIHDGHNASAALIVNGELVSAVGEEKFSREKHHYGFPHKSVEAVLQDADCNIQAVDHVAIATKRFHQPISKLAGIRHSQLRIIGKNKKNIGTKTMKEISKLHGDI